MDSLINREEQVTSICKSAYFQLHNVGAIRQYLTKGVAAQLIHSFVTSHLDYCNSLLHGVSIKLLKLLCKIQNAVARILTLSGKFDHVTPLFKELHWCPVHLRTDLKLLLFMYLHDLLEPYTPAGSLPSLSDAFRVIPRSRTSPYGDISVTIEAPTLWNNPPDHICNADSLSSFKRQLKTHLFSTF